MEYKLMTLKKDYFSEKFFFLLTLIFSQTIIAQNTKKGVDFSDSKNSILLKLMKEKNDFFGIDNIVTTDQDKIYRFWKTKYYVEISEIDKKVTGKVIFAIQNTDKVSEYLRKPYLLNDEQVKAIFILIDQYNLNSLPTDSKINNWTSGFDGNLIVIESNINKEYIYKSYWTPQIQTVNEAKILINFIEQLDNTILSVELNRKFDAENKFTCYRYYGTSYNICNILTKKEARKLKRKRQK